MSNRGRNKFETKKSTGLIITSLIDFFSIVVIYLMKSYSSEGSILTNSENLTLPNSFSTRHPTEIHVQIAATTDMILVDNVPVVPTPDAQRLTLDSIPQLVRSLQAKFKQEKEQAKLGVANSSEAGTATIQIDKNVAFDVLYKIMNSCAEAGYSKMNFAVMERET
jgi:biopolymer transport protein ExbD